MNNCTDCGSDQLVIHVRDGDLVCTCCGLVNQSRMMIDDGVFDGNTFHTVQNDVCGLFKSKIDIFFGYQTCEGVRELACELYDCAKRNHGKLRVSMKNAMMAAALYDASVSFKMGICPGNIYTFFEVPVWAHYSEISSNWAKRIKNEDNDMLARLVYSYDAISDDKKNIVLKTARELRNMTIDSLRECTKTSKLSVCYIYIACGICDCGISKENINAFFGVSVLTITKHETLIQNVLANSV